MNAAGKIGSAAFCPLSTLMLGSEKVTLLTFGLNENGGLGPVL